MEPVLSVIRSPLEILAELFQPREGSLYSPAADVLMAGGASLLCYLALWCLVDKGTDIGKWSIALYYAAFFVNYPHFMASYQLIYKDARGSFTQLAQHRTFALKLWWAGFVVPLVLVMFFTFALLTHSISLVGYMANLMFFFVGWHYIKQIYGCVIVLSSARGVYYAWYERWSILIPLYALWAISFISANLYGGQNSYYQIVYNAAKIPRIFLETSYTLLALSTFVMVSLIVRKFVMERNAPPLSAMVALLSIYVWYIPAFSHPFYLYIIPLFHSLQYLLFVGAYERNTALSENREVNPPLKTFRGLTHLGEIFFLALPIVAIALTMYATPPAAIDFLLVKWYGTFSLVPGFMWAKSVLVLALVLVSLRFVRQKARMNVYWKFTSFFFTAFLLGALMFVLLPTIFDILVRNRLLPGGLSYDYSIFGVSLYLYFFTVAINIHHYFIDNVIWKSNNPHIRAHLFAPKL